MLPTMRGEWDPFETFGRELSRAWGRGDGNGDRLFTAAYPVDIHEDENHLYVEAELPGFRKDEIDITLENGVLTIAGERKVENRQGPSHLNERRYTRVQRSFNLPDTVDEENVNATLEDGVLKLTLNKKEEVKPRKIQLK